MQIDDNKRYDSISAMLLHATEVGNVLAKWIETAEPTYCACLRNTQLSAILLFLSEILNFVIKKDKNKDIDSFIKFAAKNRKVDNNFKFNREECYGR